MTTRDEQIRDMAARYSVEEMAQVIRQISGSIAVCEDPDDLTELQNEFDLWKDAMEKLVGYACEAT